jgi:hypothetical protein
MPKQHALGLDQFAGSGSLRKNRIALAGFSSIRAKVRSDFAFSYSRCIERSVGTIEALIGPDD